MHESCAHVGRHSFPATTTFANPTLLALLSSATVSKTKLTMDPGMGSAGDVPPSSAPPPEERDHRDLDRADHPPESSNGDAPPRSSGHGYREKQIKVLRSYPVALCVLSPSVFLSPAFS